MGPPSLGNAWMISVLQASPACPLIRMAQEPQMALRHEQRRASVPSVSSRMRIRPSNTVLDSVISRVYS